RMVTFVPHPVGGFDDNLLKIDNWTPPASVISGATAYANKHAAWINQLWALVIPVYFGNPLNDQSTIWMAYNLIKLARQVYPNRRIVIQTCGERDTSWYTPGGIVPNAVVNQFAGVIRSAHPEGVLIWGHRAANKSMLAAFGVDVSSITDISITATRTTTTTLSPGTVSTSTTSTTGWTTNSTRSR